MNNEYMFNIYNNMNDGMTRPGWPRAITSSLSNIQGEQRAWNKSKFGHAKARLTMH